MYKVFFNERRIAITAKRNITLIKPLLDVNNFTNKDDVLNWFLQFSQSDIEEVVLCHSNPQNFWNKLFLKAFEFVPAAGGIVLRGNKILFIFRNEKWDLPKGKIDAGEVATTAALREVEEECGISGHEIVKQLPSTFHIFQSPFHSTLGKLILKETFWFEMDYQGTKIGTPEKKEGITKINWVEKSELDEVLSNTYENLKPIINLYRV